MPESEEVKLEKALLSNIIYNASLANKLKFIPLETIPKPPLHLNDDDTQEIKERKMLLNRLDTLWAVLQPPDSVKLEFKFIIKVLLEHISCF